MTKTIAVAAGDGIGPEICEATLRVLKASDVPLKYEMLELGEKAFLNGEKNGIPPEAWDIIHKNKVLLKAPITTPQGGGYKSLNVTIRKTLGLYANVRPCMSYSPYVSTRFPETNMVIIRENEEDLYAGIEYRLTDELYESLKLVTRSGCERIIRYAFEYARLHNRRKVTCMSKDNIMKMTDGLFHKTFNEIASEYQDISTEHYIIDIGSAHIATNPEKFDVVVTMNLYGDIISDIAAQITGSVGLAGSANIGQEYSMFEAIHGSAPDIAGQGIANPTGMLMASVMMLQNLSFPEQAGLIHNAILKTIEDGIHTADLYSPERSLKKVSTSEFADEIIKRLGEEPSALKKVTYNKADDKPVDDSLTSRQKDKPVKKLAGVDVFIDNSYLNSNEIAEKVEKISNPNLSLKKISNRGLAVWPEADQATVCSDAWVCRFEKSDDSKSVSNKDIIQILSMLNESELDFVKTEHLYEFDGVRSYST